MTKEEVIDTLSCNTHSLFNVEFLDEVNSAFGTDIAPIYYDADGASNPKGLTLDGGRSGAKGIAAFDLAPILCTRLGIEYTRFMGRGFQVRECCNRIRSTL